MSTQQRYEVLQMIGSGDFAVVYRARDRELGREVAVKQIHQQFLADPQKLEQYWREAQLLANLEHPNIMTVYDIDRRQGWLVLELMQGSLKDKTAGQPMNLDYLRVTLFHCLHALKFMHAGGIVHGDIKPGNMLLDKRSRIKIGDFGLARRATDDEGSLLKGTTKYMAPEVFSEQFGPVTPASDLYSLGFSAYELLCGAHFDDLFPGLNAFGRDKQIAWIMWHAAADRRLPEIGRVMEGVPEDLARVIERLVEKDPARRYRSADEALADLVQQPGAVPQTDEVDEAAEAEAKAQRRKRMTAIAAVSVSLVLSLVMLFLPQGEKKPPTVQLPEPQRGVVRQVSPRQKLLVLDAGKDQKPAELQIRGNDEVRLNDRMVLLSDLRPGDRVIVRYEMRDQRKTKIIIATRPETSRGQVKRLDADRDEFVLSVEGGAGVGLDLRLKVPSTADVTLNEQPVEFTKLKEGDFVEVTHAEEGRGRVVTVLAAIRAEELNDGVIRDVQPGESKLTIAFADPPGLVTLTWSEKCQVTLNGLDNLNGALLKPADLKPDDKVRRLLRDTQILRVDVYRQFEHRGHIVAIRPSTGTLDVSTGEPGEFLTFRPRRDAKVQLAGRDVALADLHRRDRVTITHDSPNRKNLEAIAIKAIRPVDTSKWAIVIGVKSYDDKTLPPLKSTDADARELRRTLVDRYGLEPDQAVLLADASRIRLEQEIPRLMEKAAGAGQLLVYFAGHAFVDEEAGVLLAPADCALSRLGESGLKLKWLVDQLESCQAREKVLLLDCCHATPKEIAPRQPSTVKMVQVFKAKAPKPAFRTTHIIASCQLGQRGVVLPDQGRGLFSLTLSAAFTGRADANGDNRVTAAELFEFAKEEMPKTLGPGDQIQTPELFLPDDTPPRLTEDAKKAIRALLAQRNRARVDLDEALPLYESAKKLAPDEPEPKLAWALVLLKSGENSQAFTVFENVKLEHADLLLAHQGLVWVHFVKRNYVTGINTMTQIVGEIRPPKKPGQPYSDEALSIFAWVGRLRAYAAGQKSIRAEDAIKSLDEAIAEHGKPALDPYTKSRVEVDQILQKYDAQLAEAPNEGARLKIGLQRKKLVNYVKFPLAEAAKSIDKRLEK